MIDDEIFDMLVLHQYVAQITLKHLQGWPKKTLCQIHDFPLAHSIP